MFQVPQFTITSAVSFEGPISTGQYYDLFNVTFANGNCATLTCTDMQCTNDASVTLQLDEGNYEKQNKNKTLHFMYC